jgi:hypothetical protein
VSRPYTTTGKFIVPYFLIGTFWTALGKNKYCGYFEHILEQAVDGGVHLLAQSAVRLQ